MATARSVSPASASTPISSSQYAPVTLTPTDPAQRFVADSALEFLLAEVVTSFHTDIATAAQISAENLASAIAQITLAGGASATTTISGPGAVRTSRVSSTPALKTPEDLTELTENSREQAYYKLENMGYRVGMAFVERLTRDRPRFVDALDIVKFICKEFWTAVFRKQVDNLKTNHKGVYVLTDNQFRWFMRMSADGGMAETVKRSFPVSFERFALESCRFALTNPCVGSFANINSLSTLPFRAV